MRLLKLFLVGGLAAVLTACGAPVQQNSTLDGHYENTTAREMERFRNAQFVVPEYAPVSEVIVGLPLITNYQREDLIAAILDAGADRVYISYNGNIDQSVFRNLIGLLGPRTDQVRLVRHELRSTQPRDAVTVWARDWAPLGAVATRGDSIGDLRLVDFNYYLSREFDDFSAQAYANAINKERVSVPVYNEGGNFMNNDAGHCMMTDRVVYANSREAYNTVGRHPLDMVLSKEEIISFYKDFAGCKEVTIFDAMPHEGTGHIDMFAKFLDNNTVLVSEMELATIRTLREGSRDYNAAIDIRNYLESVTAQIRGFGYQVVRAPMPAPNTYQDASNVLRSYTNSLLVNGVAIIPQYRRGGLNYDYRLNREFYVNYADQGRISDYEARVTRIYREAGYDVVWIDSDRLIANGGAVHCVTMQLPKL